jgi:hypothetical protein
VEFECLLEANGPWIIKLPQLAIPAGSQPSRTKRTLAGAGGEIIGQTRRIELELAQRAGQQQPTAANNRTRSPH